jgi:hypothetical protein
MFKSSSDRAFERIEIVIELEGADALEAEDVVDAEDVGIATGTLGDDTEPIFMAKPHGCLSEQQSLRYGDEHGQRRHALDYDPTLAKLIVT